MVEDSFVAEDLETANTVGEARPQVNLPVAFHITSCWCRNKYAGAGAIDKAAAAVWRYSEGSITRYNGYQHVV